MNSIDTTGWSTSAHQIGERAWRWLEVHYRQFELPSDVPVGELDAVRHLKPIAELALVGSIATREGSLGRHAAGVAETLMEFGWAQLRGGDLLVDLLRERPFDTFALESYVSFVRAGRRHGELEALLAHLTTLRSARVPEHPPNRTLAVLNAQRLVGLDAAWDPSVVLARTWLGATPEPWAADLATLYAMTHTVFHLTDFGARPRGLPSELQDYLGAWLPVWLDVYLEAGHWDIVAELLVVDLCLSEPTYPPGAWPRVAAAQLPDGMLPAEAWRDTRNPATRARNHYHSTVLAALAGTVAVARQLDSRRS